MLIGVNWTYPQTFPLIKKLSDHHLIDFCEISLDNFIHLSPEVVLSTLQDIPVSFHMLSSRFLEKPDLELKEMASHARHWIRVLQPMYVSDHLAQFTHQNKQLPIFMELNYLPHYHSIKNRVSQWQELLDCTVFFENFASSLGVAGNEQPDFFAKLLVDTGAGLLFDFSNAYIAEQNQVCVFEKWNFLLSQVVHCHVGGFRKVGSPPLVMDTHDEPVADEVYHLIKSSMPRLLRPKSIVIEYDMHMSFERWQEDILKMKSVYSKEVCA